MLTNEQRAHDLAVASLSDEKIVKSFYTVDENGEHHINLLDIYVKIYNLYLEELNNKFPNHN